MKTLKGVCILMVGLFLFVGSAQAQVTCQGYSQQDALKVLDVAQTALDSIRPEDRILIEDDIKVFVQAIEEALGAQIGQEFDYCEFIWTIQPAVELVMMSIQGYVLIDGTCPWFAVGIVVDIAFWIPLACLCNSQADPCFFWAFDMAYNAFMFSVTCL